MMRVYLAGPMTGHPGLNFAAFADATVELRARGYDVWSPAEADLAAGLDPDETVMEAPRPLAEYLVDDLAEVCRSEAVVVLPGWEASRGARIEVGVARGLGLPVLAYPSLDSVPADPAVNGAATPAGAVPAPALSDGRERVTNAETGGVKERKPARFDLLPWAALWEVAEHYGRGAEKYSDHNWTRGYAWSLSIGAAGRHLAAIASGEDIDVETGSPHAAALAFHALALLTFRREQPGLDDRRHVPVAARPWTLDAEQPIGGNT